MSIKNYPLGLDRNSVQEDFNNVYTRLE